MGDGEFSEQLGDVAVEDTEALPAGLVGQGTGPGFSAQVQLDRPLGLWQDVTSSSPLRAEAHTSEARAPYSRNGSGGSGSSLGLPVKSAVLPGGGSVETTMLPAHSNVTARSGALFFQRPPTRCEKRMTG